MERKTVVFGNGPRAGQTVTLDDLNVVVNVMVVANGMPCEHMPFRFTGLLPTQFILTYKYDPEVQMMMTDVDWAYATYRCKQCDEHALSAHAVKDEVNRRVKARLRDIRENVEAAFDELDTIGY